MDNCYVYMLRCNDNTLYTGYAKHVDKRLIAHNNGTGAKYTRNRRPVYLVYVEDVPSKSQALKREIAIKKLSRFQKLKLIEECTHELIYHSDTHR